MRDVCVSYCRVIYRVQLYAGALCALDDLLECSEVARLRVLRY